MNYEDLISFYEQMRAEDVARAPQRVSELLRGFHGQFVRERGRQYPGGDHEQAWRAFKGKNLEKLIVHIIGEEIEALGLSIAQGPSVKKAGNGAVQRNLEVNYDEFGSILPDVDIVVYHPLTFNVVLVLSIKVTLRERVAQTGYWKLKLAADPRTQHIRVIFITLDEDGTLTHRDPCKKGRVIVETDTDSTYVITEAPLEESQKVKRFDRFISDLKELIHGTQNSR